MKNKVFLNTLINKASRFPMASARSKTCTIAMSHFSFSPLHTKLQIANNILSNELQNSLITR